jgi:hypothetical protein
MNIAARSADRVKALASVLSLTTWHSDRLVGWAIHKLGRVHTPEADAELDRFEGGVFALPEESPVRRRFAVRAYNVRYLQQMRQWRPQQNAAKDR